MMDQPTSPVPADARAPGDGQPAGDAQETFNAPVTALGDVQEGSTITCQVVSIDSQSGVATLALAQDEPEAPAGGTDGMADEFADPSPGSQPS